MPGVDTVDLLVAIARAEREGRTGDADEAFRRSCPLLVFEMQTIDHYNACAKHVLRRRGVIESIDLRPAGPAPAERESVERLDAYLENIDFVGVATVSRQLSHGTTGEPGSRHVRPERPQRAGHGVEPGNRRGVATSRSQRPGPPSHCTRERAPDDLSAVESSCRRRMRESPV